MFSIILGNALSLVAVVFNYLNGTKKVKRDMIIYDIYAAASYTLADLVLKGYSGVVQNAVGVLRNLTVLFLPNDKIIGRILVVVGVVLGVYVNNHGIIGVLPIITSLYYSICVINRNCSGKAMKLALILNSLAYLLYSLVLYNVVGVVSNLLVMSAAIRAYLQMSKEENK